MASDPASGSYAQLDTFGRMIVDRVVGRELTEQMRHFQQARQYGYEGHIPPPGDFSVMQQNTARQYLSDPIYRDTMIKEHGHTVPREVFDHSAARGHGLPPHLIAPRADEPGLPNH